MAHRKLQQEVDKVFKKITEGLDVFDMYYERHEACSNNPPQKEKLESDLKREVKKLQRLREQIKSWQSSPEIKDKDSLLDYRRSVEIAMEKYKVVEKASKEKAYSNISLKKSEILEPEELERQETSNYLLQQIDELERQYDLLQIDIDDLFLLNKKKKTYSPMNEEKIESMKNFQVRYRWHQQQMELALRLLANEELSPDTVNEIQDDINYYVESNQDEDFVEDESIYDSLDLHTNKAIAHEVSQSFVAQVVEDEEEANSPMTYTNLDLDEFSKLSKKDQRRVEREAKKAAKQAAKTSAPLTESQGPSVSVKMENILKSSSPEPEKEASPAPQATIQTKASEAVPVVEQKPSSALKLNVATPMIETTQGMHTHIHQGQDGVTSSTILKPATVPVRPAGDLKWSVAAAQSIDKEKKATAASSLVNSTLSGTTSSVASPTVSTAITPRLATPSLLSQTEKPSNIALESLNGTTSSLSSVTAAANQNNQQFHRNLSSPQSGTVYQQTIASEQDYISEQKLDSLTSFEQIPQAKFDEEDEISSTIIYSSYDEEDDEEYEDELFRNIQQQQQTPEEIASKETRRKQLEDIYINDFDTLSLPNGIKEFMMGYEIFNNKLYANDGKLGGFRHSVDMCSIERLNEVPFGVNPPNPLDAFRSSQQWDTIRCSIDTDNKDLEFESIKEKFRGLEMFSLFYNYYFAVTSLEKKIALELLRERNWKVADGETMWFLRQGEPKFQNESFEIGDFKIFKLDDWSVIDKINFKLDYANLVYKENNTQLPDRSLEDIVDDIEDGEEIKRELSHGQQLLQQLKLGKA